MKELAPGVWQLSGFPPNAINVFVIGDVLIDASTRYHGGSILKQLKGREVNAHALTHAHPDHQGASHKVCTTLGIPYWVGANDADAAENPDLIGERQPNHPIAQFFAKTMTGPAHPVDRKLVEGDDVAGFEVVHIPGHAPGQIALHRKADGIALTTDGFYTVDPEKFSRSAPRVAHEGFNEDSELARESIRKLAALDLTAAWPGHSDPIVGDVKGELLRAADST